jgi:hypothetical protein
MKAIVTLAKKNVNPHPLDKILRGIPAGFSPAPRN